MANNESNNAISLHKVDTFYLKNCEIACSDTVEKITPLTCKAKNALYVYNECANIVKEETSFGILAGIDCFI